MIRFLLCDDDSRFLERLRTSIQTILKQEKISFSTHAFKGGEEIPLPLLGETDVFFLDIDFAGAGYTGMDLAKRIREVNERGIIVFVTNFIAYAPAGYEVHAFRYLLKSEIGAKLRPCIAQVIAQLQEAEERLFIQAAGKTLTFSAEDVLYIESQDHTAVIYVQSPECGTGREYKLYTTLGNLEKQLEDKGFLRVQKSYLVNMRRIQKYQCTGVTLDTGQTLKVSQKSYGDQKKIYLLWKGGN